MESLLRSIRHAFRRLLRAPVFSLTVVATLALGVGATTAVFTLVNAVLLRPLPYPGSERLVAVRHNAPGFGITDGGQSDGTYLHYREQNRVFEEMGAYLENVVTLTDRDDPERIQIALVTPSVFPLLGARPAAGRLFTEADAAADAPSVVVISHELWARRYGSDPAIVGKTIEINRSQREVVGVAPPGLDFPRRDTRLWYATSVEASKAGVRDLHMGAIARLKPGVSADEARRDLDRLVPTLAETYADVTPQMLREGQFQASVVPLKEAIVGDVRPALVLLLCTAAFVLLITWANVANLFLVRAERQRKEVAVERALGASGGQMALRFMGESVLLTLFGGALGLVLALAAVRSGFGFQPGEIPRLDGVRVGAGGVALAATLSVLSGLLLGGISLLRAGRADMVGSIKGAGRTTVGREGLRAQRLLVALQVALALTLLIGSAVMVQSFWRLKAVDLGFRPEQVTTFEISLPFRQYPKFQDAARFQHELLGRLAATPGVTSVGAGVGVPLTPVPDYLVEPFTAEDRPAGRGEIPPPASVNLVTPGYFETMGIPIVRGRGFGRGDLLGESLPVVLTPASARALFGAEDPVGRRVRLAGKESYPAYTVVGVAGPVPGEKLADGPASMVYFPVTDDLQGDTAAKVPVPFVPREAITVVVRSTLPTATLAPTVRRLVRDLDAKVPIASIRPMGQIVEDATARTRLTTLLLLVAAGAAVLLGIIGIYGIVAYTVGQRTREFGVRLALGATAADVNRLVLRQGVRLTLAGIAAGLLAAFGLTRFMRGLLFEVSPGNPLAFAAMSAALLGVALAATYLPARRAGRIDPAQTLKAE